jgi:hypothetical protein
MEQQREAVVLLPDEGPVIPDQRTHHWQAENPAVCTVATLWEHCWLRDHPDDGVDIPDDLGHREHEPQHALDTR